MLHRIHERKKCDEGFFFWKTHISRRTVPLLYVELSRTEPHRRCAHCENVPKKISLDSSAWRRRLESVVGTLEKQTLYKKKNYNVVSVCWSHNNPWSRTKNWSNHSDVSIEYGCNLCNHNRSVCGNEDATSRYSIHILYVHWKMMVPVVMVSSSDQ